MDGNSTEAATLLGNFKKFPSILLLGKDIDVPCQVSPEDISPDLVRFERLVELLWDPQTGFIHDDDRRTENMRIYWKIGEDHINIASDRELTVARSRQRDDKEWVVNIFVYRTYSRRSETDIQVEHISFDALAVILRADFNVSFSTSNKALEFTNSAAGNRYATVLDDAQLRYALIFLRDYESDTIELRMVW